MPKASNPAELVIFGNPKSRRRRKLRAPNPESASETEQAIALFRQFHGHEPEEILSQQRSTAMRLDYVTLGDLFGLAPYVEDLKIPPVSHWDDGGYPVLLFQESKIVLASNADGTQLYAIGGDQNISGVLGDFPEMDSTKDLLDLGELAYIVYEARKSMDSNQLKEYVHTFDEPRPRLGYDQVKHEMFFIGGRYTIEAPGIDH